MTRITSITSYVLLASATFLSSCGETRDSAGTASATTQFTNSTTMMASLAERLSKPWLMQAPDFRAMGTEDPTKFKMKLISVYITEDIDPDTQSNVGNTSMIYLNPDCQEDIMHCDISAGTAEDNTPYTNIISSYFDFGASTEDVNGELNAQAREITTGTYKYARMEFCKVNESNANNILWASVSSGGDQEFQRNQCTVNSSEFATPLVIADGDSVTVDISYDLTGIVQNNLSSATGDDCTGTAPNIACFTMPTFVPSAL